MVRLAPSISCFETLLKYSVLRSSRDFSSCFKVSALFSLLIIRGLIMHLPKLVRVFGLHGVEATVGHPLNKQMVLSTK